MKSVLRCSRGVEASRDTSAFGVADAYSYGGWGAIGAEDDDIGTSVALELHVG